MLTNQNEYLVLTSKIQVIMSKIKYLIQSKSNNAQIYLRLSMSKNGSIKRRTGLLIDSKEWSKSTGLPKQNNPSNKVLASKLRKLSDFVYDELNNSQNKVINGDWLVHTINSGLDKKEKTKDLDYLVEYGEDYISRLSTKVTKSGKIGVSNATKKKYRTIVNKLINFEKYRNKKILLEEVDSSMAEEFISYFSEVDKLNDNTIGRYLKFIKSICLDAKKKGIKVSRGLEDFKGFTVDVPKVYLSFEELEKIEKTDLINNNHLIARDWLIIGCYIGQRVSDLLRLNCDFIHSRDNFKFISLKQIKTDKEIEIPLHFKVKEILDKRNGDFPPVFSKNVDSNKAMFNRYLKELCKIAEIDEISEGKLYDKEEKRYVYGKYKKHLLVSSHICRRSFATNFYSDKDYPTPMIMNITGHSTETMFLLYIGKKPIDYSMQLAEIWAKKAG